MIHDLPKVDDIPKLMEQVPEKYFEHVRHMAQKMVTHPNYGRK